MAYELIDIYPSNGLNYYRLKEVVGLNGEVEDLGITYAYFNNEIQSEIAIYPNPSSSTLHFESKEIDIDFEEVKLFNTLGQSISIKKPIQVLTSTKGAINVEDLESGLYFLQVNGTYNRFTKN